MWYNNGEQEIILGENDEVPDGFTKGRLKRDGTREREVKAFLYNHAPREFVEYYSSHNVKDTCEYFGFSSRKVVFDVCKKIDFCKSNPTMPTTPTRSHESYISGGKKSALTQKENWANKTEEEKEFWSRKMSECHLNGNYGKIKAEQNTAYRASLSPEENERQNKMRSASMRKWWANLSPEEKQSQINKHFENGAGYHTANSKPNLAFKKLLEDNGFEFSREFRIGNYSYDFKVGNILIEIDPAATHNVTWSPFGEPISKTYHRDKSRAAKQSGFRCIHIFDWDDVNKIISLLKKRKRIYARQCKVCEISKEDAIKFLNEYHLQGYAKDSIRLGLKHSNELVAVMTFGKPRYNKNFEYELVRFCSKDFVVGGAEKLFKYFKAKYNPTSVISYCDASKFDGKVYTILGFVQSGESLSSHWYSMSTKTVVNNNLLLQRGFDQLFGTSFGKGTSNEELMIDNGFVEVYDAGQLRFEYVRGQ